MALTLSSRERGRPSAISVRGKKRRTDRGRGDEGEKKKETGGEREKRGTERGGRREGERERERQIYGKSKRDQDGKRERAGRRRGERGREGGGGRVEREAPRAIMDDRPLLGRHTCSMPPLEPSPLLEAHTVPVPKLPPSLQLKLKMIQQINRVHRQMGFSLAPTWRAWWFRLLGGQSSWHSSGQFYWPAKLAEGFLLLLILTNVAAVVMVSDTSAALEADKKVRQVYWGFEVFSIIVFTIEYALRAWTTVEDPAFGNAGPIWGRLQWARSPLPLLDLFSIIPFIVDAGFDPDDDSFRGATLVRLLRLFSLMRLERGFGSFARISSVIRKKGNELFTTVFVAAIILIVSSSLMYYIESPYNPKMYGHAAWRHCFGSCHRSWSGSCPTPHAL
eukprot:scaffold115844_cov29-Tisochrysis_lutea.AAC.2